MTSIPRSDISDGRPGTAVAHLLVFVSGFAALVYQVLWMKQLGLLFGNTSHAASVTLAAFFAGLALGSWRLGRRVATAPNPLRTYAWLEFGIAVTALAYFLILHLYHAIYPAIFQSVGSGAWLLLIKFALALLLILPPAFCMGGTIPVIGQYVVRSRDAFGITAALIYGVNTLGAAIGAALAGFYLPLRLGYNATCLLAIALSASVGVVAYLLSRGGAPLPQGEMPIAATKTATVEPEPEPEKLSRKERRQRELEAKRREKKQPAETDRAAETPARGARVILAICFLSGFGVLALEVLWTRMFSQVLENSVYTFAVILVIVLLCLALGALISAGLARLGAPPFVVLALLIALGAGAVTATPYVFMRLTDDMRILVSAGSWSGYLLLIAKTAGLTIGPPALLLGTIFPYLMKTEEQHLTAPGLSLGRLATANTIGAILGALVCGFLLLDWLGMWRSMQAIAVVYLIGGLVLPVGWRRPGIVARAVCLLLLLLHLVVLQPERLPVISTDPLAHREQVVEVWEGSDCTVSVTDSQVGLAIKINSHYSLGSTGAYMQETLQADIPLMVKPATQDIFFLGVGTGITAGSALDRRHADVQRVVACELVPEVVTAARKYFTDIQGFDSTNGLFTDPRATVLVEDGRHYLMATDEQFDMINADLFVPFRSGAGSLYTREHFESARARLKPGGVFVQWLPMYQLTAYEFGVIAHTMIESFDQVSLWRHNFQPGDEVVALVGHLDGAPLPACDLDSRADKRYAVSGKTYHDLQRLALPFDPQTILFFYGGNLTAARELFADYPLNTDDRPVIEYMAPRSYRSQSDGVTPWFVGTPLVELIEQVQAACPPDQDPLLVNRTPANRRLPLAGSHFHRARIAEVAADTETAHAEWRRFVLDYTDQ